jgi:hypothetical protein
VSSWFTAFAASATSTVVRLAPLDRREAAAMVRSLRTFPLLAGYRGAPLADVEAVEDIVVALSALAARTPRSPSSTTTRCS